MPDMNHRRSYNSVAALPNYDDPPARPAAHSSPDNVYTRLHRLRRTLERHREDARRETERLSQSPWSWSDGRTPEPMIPRRRSTWRPGRLSAALRDRDNKTLQSQQAQSCNAKKRKLSHDASTPDMKPFRYGYYGQVQPGRLLLKLYDYSGGVYSPMESPQSTVNYGPENMLKHDRSVYCSRDDECTMMLLHHDRGIFSLDRIHIVAPDKGFSAPVCQGSIYVARSLDDIVPCQKMLDEDIQARHREERRMHHDACDQWPFQVQTGTEAESRDSSNAYQAMRDAYGRSPTTVRTRSPALHSTVAGTVPHQLSNVRVTPSDQDNIEIPEDPTSSDIEEDRQRRTQFNWGTALGDPCLDDPDMPSDLPGRPNWGLCHDESEQWPWRVSHTKHKGGNVLHATFKIQPEKNKITLKFDPPVVGSAILLHLVSPVRGRNIDIQSFIACGYAGPRYLPSLEYI